MGSRVGPKIDWTDTDIFRCSSALLIKGAVRITNDIVYGFSWLAGAGKRGGSNVALQIIKCYAACSICAKT